MTHLKNIECELNTQFLERSVQIRGILVALLANQHILFLGPPGTAKSALVHGIQQRLTGSQAFTWLMSRFTTPDELFGPVSLKGLENEEYRRLTTGKLPECQIAFLDEVFKANSAILNALLSLLNERVFYNNGQPVPCPLITLFGASNELPEDESLQALYDRFALRYWVDYLSDPGFEKLLTSTSISALSASISVSDLATLQAQVPKVQIPQSIIDALVKLRIQLRSEEIEASDRRWKQCLKLLQAHALLEGRNICDEEDLSILEHALWNHPDQRKAIAKAIRQFSSSAASKGLEIQDRIKVVFDDAMAAQSKLDLSDELKSKALFEANMKIKAANGELAGLIEQAQVSGKSTVKLDAVKASLTGWSQKLVNVAFGV
jgi:MoxR-like ATPase